MQEIKCSFISYTCKIHSFEIISKNRGNAQSVYIFCGKKRDSGKVQCPQLQIVFSSPKYHKVPSFNSATKLSSIFPNLTGLLVHENYQTLQYTVYIRKILKNFLRFKSIYLSVPRNFLKLAPKFSQNFCKIIVH